MGSMRIGYFGFMAASYERRSCTHTYTHTHAYSHSLIYCIFIYKCAIRELARFDRWGCLPKWPKWVTKCDSYGAVIAVKERAQRTKDLGDKLGSHVWASSRGGVGVSV